MSPAEQIIRRIITIVVAVLVPLALFLSAIRLVINPLFLQVEYSMPGFPADQYGFTKQDRLRWAPYAVDYLVNDQGINYLRDLEFEDGTPLYNERELSHMVDVKNLVQLAINVSNAVLGVLIGLGLAAWGAKWSRDYLRGLGIGGWATIALIMLLLFGVLVSFSQLFTAFHRIFFEGDTWLFYYSDTLIRLFPMRFWQDAFITVGAVTILGALALGLIFRKYIRA